MSHKDSPKILSSDVSIPEVTPLVLVHPPNLPLRPYLDDIWDVLTGFDGSIGTIGDDITDIQNDITDIQNDILDIQTNCCGGGTSPNLEGGHAASIYTAVQFVDGGGA